MKAKQQQNFLSLYKKIPIKERRSDATITRIHRFTAFLFVSFVLECLMFPFLFSVFVSLNLHPTSPSIHIHPFIGDQSGIVVIDSWGKEMKRRRFGRVSIDDLGSITSLGPLFSFSELKVSTFNTTKGSKGAFAMSEPSGN